jgi:hypothetical protein
MKIMSTKTQTRGNCPCCGRDQAVLASGRMSKHGYTVDNGWFNGVCSGERFEPMQVQREVTDQLVVQVRREVKELEAAADDCATGRRVPKTVTRGWGKNEQQVPFADAHPWEQSQAVHKAEWANRNRARAGQQFADFMEKVVNEVHGQPLREVEVADAPAPVRSGEQRKAPNGHTLTVRYVDRGRVYWADERGFRSWTGTQAFRKYPMA